MDRRRRSSVPMILTITSARRFLLRGKLHRYRRTGPKSLGNSVTIISGLPDVAKWRRGESPLNFSRRRDPGYCLIPRLLVIRLRTFSDENFVRGPSSSSPMSPVSPARGYKSGRKKAGRKFRTEAAFAKRGRRGECTRGEGGRGNTGGAWNREIRGRSDAN